MSLCLLCQECFYDWFYVHFLISACADPLEKRPEIKNICDSGVFSHWCEDRTNLGLITRQGCLGNETVVNSYALRVWKLWSTLMPCCSFWFSPGEDMSRVTMVRTCLVAPCLVHRTHRRTLLRRTAYTILSPHCASHHVALRTYMSFFLSWHYNIARLILLRRISCASLFIAHKLFSMSPLHLWTLNAPCYSTTQHIRALAMEKVSRTSVKVSL